MRASKLVRAAALAGLVLASNAAATPSTRRVIATPAQMLSLAEEMAKRGKSGDAETLLDLLARDPDRNVRNEARFRHARLLLGLKRHREAALLLRQLLDEKPEAAPARFELARAMQLLGDTNGALRELRAVQSAGLPPAVARLIDRYSAALRAQRPFGASIEIALAPDSNINRATRSDTLGTVLGDFEIADDGKAKSGTGIAIHAQAYRRIRLGEDLSLLFRATGLADLYKSKTFNDIAADFAVGPELNLGKSRIQLELGATQRWYGQKPFMRSARVAATVSHPLGRRTLLRLSGSAALVDNQRNDLQDGKDYSAQFGIERALSATTGIAASFGLNRESLKDPGYSTTGWRGGLTAWREMERVTLTVGGELGRLHADERLLLFPHKRADRYARLSLGASVRRLSFHGFAPVVRLVVERNKSTIAFYDYSRRRVEFGFERAF